MKFDIDSLRALQTVVDAGSVEAAAHQLCVSRSAVSWKLKRLQERTGCKLLEKEGRRLRLTEDGHELLAYGRQIIDIHDAAVRRFQPVNSPYVVRIGATEGAGSAPILDTVAPWFRRYPLLTALCGPKRNCHDQSVDRNRGEPTGQQRQ